jgi:hypothetical protein
MSSFAQITSANWKQRFQTLAKRSLLFDPDILGSVVANQQAFSNRNELRGRKAPQ